MKLCPDPPLTPKLKIFIFNVTNPEEVLAGKIPNLQELGPYVYSAHQTKNVTGKKTKTKSWLFVISKVK